MKTFKFTNEQLEAIVFNLRNSQTELLLKWTNESEDKEAEEAYKKLYYECKNILKLFE